MNVELIERDVYVDKLQSLFESAEEKEGHCVFISGEAGIGKSSLVKVFTKELKKEYNIYRGTCDALFTPRPLAPLYDILLQLGSHLPESNIDITDRSAFFSRFLHDLRSQEKTSILIFEDIHWADEATLDFIKSLSRRITQLPCLFILTYRDNEIHSSHPLRNILGQLNADSFTRLQLLPLSSDAVDKMAEEKGYNGRDVYTISGGNPFYVNEILASYSTGIPDNIRDSVLSVYNRLDAHTKQIWDILCVMPTAFEVAYLEKIDPTYGGAIENCLALKILIIENELVFFKHELYRRTIEVSLSPFLRVALNKKVLELFKESFEKNHKIEQIIHHAKNANEYEMVVQYAPLAARQAALVGAHIEASRLYLTAIEYYQGNDMDTLIGFYEAYAYECYLTNQINEAIIYTGKSLALWKKKNDTEKTGNCLRFLSRLWWFDGNGKQAESFGKQAIEVLQDQPSSKIKAMAYSNMSQLKMLADDHAECISWGEKAIQIAKETGDEETLSHALNNIGAVKMRDPLSAAEGKELLQQSLEIAQRNSFHEHVARAYTNLCTVSLITKDYTFSEKLVNDGIRFCEAIDLDAWTFYMLSTKARLLLETGHWEEAYTIADKLLQNEAQPPVIKIGALIVVGTIKIRKGDPDASAFLHEVMKLAFTTGEIQRIGPALMVVMEYEWITGTKLIEAQAIDKTISIIAQMKNCIEASEFIFWLRKAERGELPFKETEDPYDISNKTKALKAAAFWAKAGAPYQQALSLYEVSEEDKRTAIAIVQKLGASAVYEKMKQEMRNSGIKSIPRGIRKTTQSNPALLTGRELDVLQLLNQGMQNKEIAGRLFISAKTVDHHISSILFKLEAKSRTRAVQEAIRLEIIK
jgi:DNA-binding CsgD family transcriptional regulator